MFDFSVVTTWFDNLLRQTLGLSGWLATSIECLLVAVGILLSYAVFAIILIYMERKVCAWIQCRLGPNRVGKWGLLQVFADVFKMLQKEIFFVDKADKLLYLLAPFFVLVASVCTYSFLPWNKGMQILDFNVGIFLLTAISSIGVVGIFLAGWGSNNKYGVVSAMRGAALPLPHHSRSSHWHHAGVWHRGEPKQRMAHLQRTHTGNHRLPSLYRGR